ncbi:integrase catalytic domain-containing protein [Trichonephila clavipes]|nr:integrase catalytic domain-containing protein [Trichonephila clavipes]
MHLHKWVTSSAELRGLWEKNGFSTETSSNSIGQNMINYKVLGISWGIARDVFYFDIESMLSFISKRTDTKRVLLQVAGRIFNPLGIIAPYMIRLKILIQNVWEMGLLWDQEMPLIIKKPFNEWCYELKDLHLVLIPRFYDFTDSNATNKQLHCFSDSSKKAYGTVIYFRVIWTDGTITTSFVTFIIRVTPLKTLSLLRFELMGALLSARLCCKVSKTLKLEKSCFFHTDSSIVYHWIQGEPFRFKPFVKNRIEEIQKLIEPSKWHHCPGKENPADIISRGISVRELKDSELWWHGPPWLQQAEQFGPKFEKQNVSNLDLELKRNTVTSRRNYMQLPKDRLLENPPFEICGLDFAGPILYKCDKEVKNCYFAIFPCAVTRGILLELVSTMCTKHSLLAFGRFISRRGSGSVVYSNNAKSFKAASKDLIYFAKILKNSEFTDSISSRGITWKFIVERAPWWGGFYERLVKSVKDLLRKILGKALFTFEELATILVEIEYIVNSRPLTYVTDDFSEPNPLTHLDFLQYGRKNHYYPFHFAELANKVSNRGFLIKRKQYQTTLLKHLE